MIYLIISLFIVSFTKYASCVPPSYCNAKTNTSDCGSPPRPVVYYYRPGSRCEIAFWRGCPTMNKFDDFYDCSYLCIFTMYAEEDVTDINNIPVQVEEDVCSKPFNDSNCKLLDEEVYTFDMETETCVAKHWHGCPTDNKFHTQQECAAVCAKTAEWMEEIKELPIENIQILNVVIDNITKELVEEEDITTPPPSELPPDDTHEKTSSEEHEEHEPEHETKEEHTEEETEEENKSEEHHDDGESEGDVNEVEVARQKTVKGSLLRQENKNATTKRATEAISYTKHNTPELPFTSEVLVQTNSSSNNTV